MLPLPLDEVWHIFNDFPLGSNWLDQLYQFLSTVLLSCRQSTTIRRYGVADFVCYRNILRFERVVKFKFILVVTWMQKPSTSNYFIRSNLEVKRFKNYYCACWGKQ